MTGSDGNKTIIFSAKRFYSGIAENYNPGHASYGQTKENKGKESYFIEEKVRKGEAIINRVFWRKLGV